MAWGLTFRRVETPFLLLIFLAKSTFPEKYPGARASLCNFAKVNKFAQLIPSAHPSGSPPSRSFDVRTPSHEQSVHINTISTPSPLPRQQTSSMSIPPTIPSAGSQHFRRMTLLCSFSFPSTPRIMRSPITQCSCRFRNQKHLEHCNLRDGRTWRSSGPYWLQHTCTEPRGQQGLRIQRM